MTVIRLSKESPELAEGVRQLTTALEEKKCLACGCLHGAMQSLEAAYSGEDIPLELATCLESARSKLKKARYDCLGCEICYPAEALNALRIEGSVCTSEPVAERPGWPPLPGSYRVLKYRAPVAVCTLTDEALAGELFATGTTEISIVGTVQTENLGVERVLYNVIANPHIRHLVLCGNDSRGAVGHLPGQSLLSLARNGIDTDGRIVGAEGRRPFVKNIAAEAVAHFRSTITVHDLIGSTNVDDIFAVTRACAQEKTTQAAPFSLSRSVEIAQGRIPKRTVPDPEGYFVIYVDRKRMRLAMEHYHNDGTLNLIIEGTSAAELYTPAIERHLVSRLDHAAYLGRELIKAESALTSGELYIQDKAPEQTPADASVEEISPHRCSSTKECL